MAPMEAPKENTLSMRSVLRYLPSHAPHTHTPHVREGNERGTKANTLSMWSVLRDLNTRLE